MTPTSAGLFALIVLLLVVAMGAILWKVWDRQVPGGNP